MEASMTTFAEFIAIAGPFTLAVVALLIFARRRIHAQMEEIAESARADVFKRPLRFRCVPSVALPEGA
jgi:hypothetical protein